MEAEVVNAIFNQKTTRAFDVMFTRDNPYPREGRSFVNIQHNYEKMRQVVLSQGYDKVWVVESDTVPPLDGLEKLLAIDAPVVGGLYALRHGTPVPNTQRWGETLRGIGGSMDWSEVKASWGKVVRTSGVCMGCVVIDRTVLWGFDFMTGKTSPPDGPFMEYCFHNGIKQMADLSVVCQHIEPNGNVLDPRTFTDMN